MCSPETLEVQVVSDQDTNDPAKANPVTHNLRRVQDLIVEGFIDESQAPSLEAAASLLSISITPEMANVIRHGVESDPIRRQFVPSLAETVISEEELSDPIGDDVHSPVPGIVHRYPDRVLLKPISVCAVYCRFCFRRETVGKGSKALSSDELEAAINYIEAHQSIWEVILTGGDPLLLAPQRLRRIVEALVEIPHVKVIRFHTRIPVVDPNRINDELVKALDCEKAVYVVLHCNHAQEITDEARDACRRLIKSGIVMLAQTVLLRGVNDDPAVMSELLRTLAGMRVKPYYLHHGDLARGTGHFRTTIEAGQDLMRSLRGDLSGICQPTYVLDIPQGFGKVPVGPSYLTKGDMGWMVEDPWGDMHEYHDAKVDPRSGAPE
jgi:lysine 2,3-aminomutase